ncbi:MAG TPA: hypothetical protein PKK12_14680, partial [Candidatus Aminicenantes bacterium]|nr:hypothetical protein [Candidatus Aminicenantes bacterium]
MKTTFLLLLGWLAGGGPAAWAAVPDVAAGTPALQKVAELVAEEGAGPRVWTDFAVDPDGRVFLLDGANVEVYTYSDRGVLLRKKGFAGHRAGEFAPFPRIHALPGEFWLTDGGQVARFNAAGKRLLEKRSRQRKRWQIPIDPRTVLALEDDFDPVSRRWRSRLNLLDLRREKTIKTLLEGHDLGCLFLDVHGQPLKVSLDEGILPDIHAAYSLREKRIYCGFTHGSDVLCFNAQGDYERRILLRDDTELLGEAEKERIAASLGIQEAGLKKTLLVRLPGRLANIVRCHPLDDSSLLVEKLGQDCRKRLFLYPRKWGPGVELPVPDGGTVGPVACLDQRIFLLLSGDGG